MIRSSFQKLFILTSLVFTQACLPGGGIKQVGKTAVNGADAVLGRGPASNIPTSPDGFNLVNSSNDGGTGSELIYDSATGSWKINHDFKNSSGGNEVDPQNFIFKPKNKDTTLDAQLVSVGNSCSLFTITNPFGGLKTPSAVITGTSDNPIILQLTPDLARMKSISAGQTVECQLSLTLDKSLVYITVRYEKPSAPPIPTPTIIPSPTPTPTPAPSPSPSPMPPPTYPNDWSGKTSCSVQPLWGLKQINVANAWSTHTDCSATKIGIIDTGADFTHTDLVRNLIKGATLTKNGNVVPGSIGQETGDPNKVFHGTHVAGTIGAEGNNGNGISGVCQTAKMIPVNIFYEGANNVNINSAINFLAKEDVKVVNLSVGITLPRNGCWPTEPSTCSKTDPYYASYLWYETAIRNNPNMLFVIAAGNDGHCLDRNCPKYGQLPAGYGSPLADLSLTLPNVLVVSAGDPAQQVTSFSNFGDHVKITAPGLGVCSTQPHEEYAAWAGTSMATPHVTGVAAMIHSYLLRKGQMPDALILQTELLRLSDKKIFLNPKINTRSNGLNIGRLGQ